MSSSSHPAPGASPSAFSVAGFRARAARSWAKPPFRNALIALIALAALLAGFYAGRESVFATDAVQPSTGRIKLKPGPWGDVEYLPITIAPPRKLLRVQGMEDEIVRWYLTGESRAGLIAALERLGVPAEVVRSITRPDVMSEHPQGIRLEPPCEVVAGLGERARKHLYEKLANEVENNPDRWEFLTDFTKKFGKFGVSRSALSNLRDVSVTYGRYTVTYAMPCVVKSIETENERVGLLKALSQQNSMLVRIRIHPDTDIKAMADYWGRGMWSTDVEAILESVQQRPDGGVVNLLEMLPPLAGALLHSYPSPHNFLSGPEVVRNCSWTAFNFFRDVPRPEFSDEAFVIKTLAEDYMPVLSDPRYGDVAVFLGPDRRMRHVAVYIADDLYFTKNGDNPWHPWVYSTRQDMVEAFSFGLPEGRELAIHYFRSKGY